MITLALLFASGLSISLSAPAQLLPMEPFPIDVTWSARRDLPRLTRIDNGRVDPTAISLEIDGAGGRRVYCEAVTMFEMAIAEPWPKGRRHRERLLVSYGYGQSRTRARIYAFPVCGSYRLRLRYDNAHDLQHAVSNWVRVRVVEAVTESDRAVFEDLRAGDREWALSEAHPKTSYFEMRRRDADREQALLEAHPKSRYFAIRRLYALLARRGRIREGLDPDAGYPVRAKVAVQEIDAWRAARYREVLSTLLEEAQGESPFEQEFLVEAHWTAKVLGDVEQAAVLEKRLSARFPGWEAEPEVPLFR